MKLCFRITGIILIILVLFMTAGFLWTQDNINDGGVSYHQSLKVRGNKLIDSNDNEIQLRGVSSHGIAWFPQYINFSAISFWKDAGANAFRISMYSDQNKGYAYYPEENKNYMYLAVENTLAADMYAIVDWHVLRDENPNVHIDKAKEFFEEISAHYKNNPGIIYEICNEPNGDTDWDDVVEYANQIIPIIRKNAPDALIITGVPNFCTSFQGVKENPLQYENIVYAFHQYMPIDGSDYDEYLFNDLIKSEIPFFVSEWGIGKKSVKEDEKIDFKAAKQFMNMMNEHNISWMCWSFSNAGTSHALIKESSEKYGDFTEEDLNQVGRFIYSELKK